MARRPIDKAEQLVTQASDVRGDEKAAPALGTGYERIRERIFTMPDPEHEYAELERALVLGTQQFDNIAHALDQAEDNARRAHRLYVCARVDAEAFSLQADIVEGGWRTKAVAELQREKELGLRTKQITDGDVSGKMAQMFEEEYRSLQQKRIESRKMLEHMERFADLWKTRCYSLATMLSVKR
jgi:hypothetical protein